MNKTEFKPNYTVHPGEILKDDLDAIGITQAKLHEITGISKTVINEIIKGKRNISAKIAVLLEKVFDFKAEYWLRLQSFYEETLARIELETHEAIKLQSKTEGIKINYDYTNTKFNATMLAIA